MSRASCGFLRVLFCLLALAATAGAAEELPVLRRSVYLSKSPKEEVTEVFVAAQAVTTLRFEHPCDPSQTKLLGWEGRFEPLLAGGKSVVIVPIKKLAPDDRFMLLVTFMDGTTLPFTLRAGERVDGQVNVFAEPESPDAVQSQLEETQLENKALQAKVQRYHQEETSVNHALAALLVANRVKLTPFKEWKKWLIHHEDGLDGEVVYLDNTPLKRLAVVFTLTNLDEKKPWKLQEARLTGKLTSKEKPFALRMSPDFIAPGQTGRIAIVMDLDSFFAEGKKDPLILELFRDGGLRQWYVYIEPRDRYRP